MKIAKIYTLFVLVLLVWCASIADAIILLHHAENLPGLHSYSTSVSVPAGSTIEFRTSSETPYTASIVRLGSDVDNPASNTTLYRFPTSMARVQPIHAGSYVHVENGAQGQIKALTLECWVRPWNTNTWAGIVTQYNFPDACEFGLFLAPQGGVSFYLSDGYYNKECRHDSRPNVLYPGMWQHIVATWDGAEKAIFVDGKEVGRWPFTGPVYGGTAPLRLGSYGSNDAADNFLDADIAMPAIYMTALSDSEIAARAQDRGLTAPSNQNLFACWPLTEETGEMASDVVGQHDGRIINHATWMIGGPSFSANVPRFGNYDPKADVTRGHGLRLASDDLYDCQWQVTETYQVPNNALPGIYAARFEYNYQGEPCVYYATFVVTKSAPAGKAPALLICSTNTWRAYNSVPFPLPFNADKLTPTQNFISTRRAPSFGLYRRHAAMQTAYYMGKNLPWPAAGPYITYGATLTYSHLARADRHTLAWLEKSGYSYDVATDSDLHQNPDILSGYKCVVISGHSEYWSIPMYKGVERYLAQGGNVLCLSGNTMYWRVSFNDNASIMECRKVNGWGAQVGDSDIGEAWHEMDNQRGGMMRECGYPAWKLVGLDTYGGHNVNPKQFGPYRVENPTHFLFTTPDTIVLEKGDTFGANQSGLPAAIGHEFDVRPSTLVAVQEEPTPAGASLPSDPAGITLLATGTCNWSVGGGNAFDYFTRQVSQRNELAGEMIWWERPGGGRVFNAGSIGVSWVMSADTKFSRLISNVLYHFGVKQEEASNVVAQKQLKADFNGDSRVDLPDFFLFATEFGTNGEGLKCDLNGDGKVDLFDFFLFTDEFGKNK